MLVLTRKEQEEIYIGNNITIKVVSTGNGRVKIGIDAPNDVRIIRGEILDQFASQFGCCETIITEKPITTSQSRVGDSLTRFHFEQAGTTHTVSGPFFKWIASTTELYSSAWRIAEAPCSIN